MGRSTGGPEKCFSYFIFKNNLHLNFDVCQYVTYSKFQWRIHDLLGNFLHKSNEDVKT